MIAKIMMLLEVFLCKTLVKRIISIVLIEAGVSAEKITEMTGLCTRSVKDLKKSIDKGDTENILKVRGGGRPPILTDKEEAEVIKEINNNNYHSKRQTADMIEEKYKVKYSESSVANLLKKTE
jgi:transposase